MSAQQVDTHVGIKQTVSTQLAHSNAHVKRAMRRSVARAVSTLMSVLVSPAQTSRYAITKKALLTAFVARDSYTTVRLNNARTLTSALPMRLIASASRHVGIQWAVIRVHVSMDTI